MAMSLKIKKKPLGRPIKIEPRKVGRPKKEPRDINNVLDLSKVELICYILYIKYGTYQKVSDKTGISRTHISNYIKNAKLIFT